MRIFENYCTTRLIQFPYFCGICFTLKKYELDLGLALGLFAIFGILRYRTYPIKVKEMTYLSVVIGISIINALSNKKMSYIEIISANDLDDAAKKIVKLV